MQAFLGTADKEARSPSADTSQLIEKLIITNTGNTTVTLNLAMVFKNGNKSILIAPKNLQINPSQSYADSKLVLPQGYLIYLTVSNGTVDYYFSMT